MEPNRLDAGYASITREYVVDQALSERLVRAFVRYSLTRGPLKVALPVAVVGSVVAGLAGAGPSRATVIVFVAIMALLVLRLIPRLKRSVRDQIAMLFPLGARNSITVGADAISVRTPASTTTVPFTHLRPAIDVVHDVAFIRWVGKAPQVMILPVEGFPAEERQWTLEAIRAARPTTTP